MKLTAPVLPFPYFQPPFQWYGRVGGIVVKNVYSGVSLCWGQASDDGFSLGAYYRPLGVELLHPITAPTPFPIAVDNGGVAVDGQQVYGYGTGSGGPWAWLLMDDEGSGKYYHQGGNLHGQAGNGTVDLDDPPNHEDWTFSATLPFPASEVVHTSTGPDSLMLLRSNGEVWGLGGTFYMGTNFHGLPAVTNLLTFTKFADDCVYCDVFDSGGAIIKSDGRLMFTGNDAYGRFGIGGAGTETDPHITWQTVPGGKVWKKVRVQYTASPQQKGNTLALDSDGYLWFAGNNLHRHTGDSARADTFVSTSFLRVPGLPRLLDFDSNGAAGYGLDYDGRLWVWGSRDEYDSGTVANALGTGSGGAEEVLTPFILLSGVIQVHATTDHCYVVKGSEEIWSWGGETFSNGGTGRGTSAGTYVPQSQKVRRPVTTLTSQRVGGVPEIQISSV